MQHDVDCAVIVPSLYCSQECEHCCRSAGPWRRERMSEQVARRLGIVLRNWWNAPTVTISGGEPLIMSRQLWKRVIDALPYGLDTIHMVSNGDFLERPAAYKRVLHYVLPELQKHLADHCDQGLCIELSGDQFHNGYNKRKWEWFKRAIGEPYDEAENDYDPILTLDAKNILLSARSYPMDNILPIGRGRNLSGGDDHNHEDCGICSDFTGQDDDYLSHTLTVYPKGDVRACCNGGPIIGTIFEDQDALMDRHADFVRKVRDLYHNGSFDSVPSTACLKCSAVARKIYQPERSGS